MNHIHENWARNDVRETLSTKSHGVIEQQLKNIHLAVCGTYKEEYDTGAKGWHIERGAPPKPLGGRLRAFQGTPFDPPRDLIGLGQPSIFS